MTVERTDYAGRLPYGLWVEPEAGEEHLFDRGYNAIATRPLAAPWRVTVHQKRRHLEAGPGRVQSWYFDDRTSPRRNDDTLAMCEKVLARFCLGRDVRFWLMENAGKKPLPGVLSPKTAGKYLPVEMNQRKMEFIAITDAETEEAEIDALLG